MKVHRQGTNRKIAANLKRHNELMRRFMMEGFSRERASELALRVLSRTPEEVEAAIRDEKASR